MFLEEWAQVARLGAVIFGTVVTIQMAAVLLVAPAAAAGALCVDKGRGTLLHALEAFEADDIGTRAFGGFYRDIFLNHKLREWERGFYPVHEEQRRSQLTFI